MVTTPLEMSTVTSHGEERPLMGQHQKKSDGALTAAAAVAMSVLLERLIPLTFCKRKASRRSLG